MTNQDILREKHGIEIEGPLGQGAEGQVFRARRLARNGRTAMPCAVKIYSIDDSFVEPPTKLLEEIRCQVQLHDSNFVVRLLDVIEEETFVALVLEECEKSFADLLEQRQSDQPGVGLPRSECYQICEQIARGLSDCHTDNVIHGDVKPHNMLLTRRGWAKLCDFGTARLELSPTFLTSRGGTLVFMLPRHRKIEREEKVNLTRDRDLFGLALSYAYLRLGRHPFRHGDPVTEQFDLTGLDEDEINVLRPILADERIPDTDIYEWFRQLDPIRLVPIAAVETFYERAALLVERVDSRRWRDGYRPDQRDIDDLRHAKALLDENSQSADSHQYLHLRSRVLATLADLLGGLAPGIDASRRLFSEAWQAINRAVELAPESAEYLAFRADLRLIKTFMGTHRLPLMFVLGPQAFDAPNSPMSSAVDTWSGNEIAESLNDITKACSLFPTPVNLARRALLLVLRAILIFHGAKDAWNEKSHRSDSKFVNHVGRSVMFPGAKQLPIWREGDSEGHFELHGDAYEFLLSEPITELDRAIELSQSPLITANLLLQRAWTRAGFHYHVRRGDGCCTPCDRIGERYHFTLRSMEGRGSVGEAIADLERALWMLDDWSNETDEVWRDSQDDNTLSSASDLDRCRELTEVVERKRQSYALWIACDIDSDFADLMGLLDVGTTSCQGLLFPLINMMYGLNGERGHSAPWGPDVYEFLKESRSDPPSPEKLGKFFASKRQF